MEVVSEESYQGKPLVGYSYAGGLTEEAIELGEEVVYSRLQRFLTENAETTRFGGKVRSVFGDELGAWEYQCVGEVRRWGWADVEFMRLGGKLVYDFQGQGVYLTEDL